MPQDAAPLSLILFDVDGTLIDSQGHIIAAMRAAFAAAQEPAPSDAAVRSIIGLSLPEAMARLAPGADNARLVRGYRDAFASGRDSRSSEQSAPLFPGAGDVIRRLALRDDLILGIATGKSRRGLSRVLECHGFQNLFVTKQVADDHPSKPHPSMVLRAAAETGVDLARTWLVGDTAFDMEMARAAGAGAIGVSWGYHPQEALHRAGAQKVIEEFAALESVLSEWENPV